LAKLGTMSRDSPFPSFWNISTRKAAREILKENPGREQRGQYFTRVSAARIYGALQNNGLKVEARC